MRVCAIAGGVGSARLATGLAQVSPDLTVVVNTADDERMRGLYVSPDVDTVLYHLAGLNEWERGWGMAKESFAADERYRELVLRSGVLDLDLQEWFALGDRDLATHMFRTRLLDLGRPLSEAIDVLRHALGVRATVLPMSDAPVRTRIVTRAGEHLDFQTYFVRRSHADPVAAVEYLGAASAPPAPGVTEAIARAPVVVLGPSNPVLSIGPLLAIPDLRRALATTAAVRVGVSPIVGGRALKGPAADILASLGHEVSPAGVAALYRGLVDVFVVDASDADAASDVEALGMRPLVLDTIMTGPESAARLAREILDAC